MTLLLNSNEVTFFQSVPDIPLHTLINKRIWRGKYRRVFSRPMFNSKIINKLNEKDIKAIVKAIRQEMINVSKEVLTFEEAAIYMGLSKSHLYKLTSKRAIPHYKPRGGMIYFNRHDVENWLLSNKVCTASELSNKSNKILKNI